MNIHELAATLNGRQYGEEITRKEAAEAARYRLVVAFGASDDLVELRGAIDEELGAWEGVTIRVDAEGYLPAWKDVDKEEEDDAADYFRRKPHAREVKVLWDAGNGYSWTIETDIPHAAFDIMEDGEKFCRGIVFSLDDLGNAPMERHAA